jgi:ABC-type histidine transport system ATPase subunit
VQRRPRADALREAEALLGCGRQDKRDATLPTFGRTATRSHPRALAMHPRVLLFDEPTSALDFELVGEVLR